MYLKHLSLTNFRNFARLDIGVPRGVVVLVGGNAQGKTSILEAIYFLAAFKDFKDLGIAPIVGHIIFFKDAVATMQLDRFVRHLNGDFGTIPFGH